MCRKILVPLDGSQRAEQVLPYVRSIAASSSAEIVLLRVAEYPYELFAGCDENCLLDPDFVKRTDLRKKAICGALTDYLEEVASRLQQDGFRAIVEVCDGPVVDAILGTVARFEVDLVAMSTRGEGEGNPWMMGSVVDRVLRESPVEVFLFRPDRREINPGSSNNPETLFERRANEIHLWSGSFS
jgi:nucleotide-binding universal stress UspA family protein